MNYLYTIVAAALIMCSAVARGEFPIRPGDRVAIVGNTFADQLRVHGYLETLLLQNSIGNPVSIRNLGWGGDTLTARDRPTNFQTEEATLTDNKTDVIIAFFGFGESFAGTEGLSEFKQDLRGFIASHAGKKYNGKSEVRLVLVSPIGYEDLGKRTPNIEKRNSELKAYSKAIGEVADTAGIPFVSLYQQSRYLMDEPGPDLTTNGVHLNAYGYWAISQILADQLIEVHQQEPWQIIVDAISSSGEATGLTLSNIEADDGGSLKMQAKELTLPSPAPPTDQPLPTQLSSRRDTLTIRNLDPGTYSLSIDGKTVAVADEEAWKKGIPIDSSPAHQAAETYRQAINDKNTQFVYSWKALNQVHIVGERKRSAAGRALPAEVIEFNKLAKQRDKALAKGIELKTRNWQLNRVPK